MPATMELNSSGILDSTAIQWQMLIGDNHIYRFSRVDKVFLPRGPAPGYFIGEITILGADDDEDAPTMSASPLEDFRIGTPCSVLGLNAANANGNAALVMTGHIRNSSPAFAPGRDAMVIEVADNRYGFDGLQLMGSFWATEKSDGTPQIEYRQGIRPLVNPNKLPNALFRTVGGRKIPFICEPNFGLLDGEGPADRGDESETKATLWTPGMELLNIWYALSAAGYSIAGEQFLNVPYNDPRLNVQWENTYADIIINKENSDTKPAASRYLDAQRVLDLIEEIADEAGDYSINFGPTITKDDEGQQEYKAKLTLWHSGYTGGGITLKRPVGDVNSNLKDMFTVNSGQINVSGEDFFSQFNAVGGAIWIETRIHSEPTPQAEESPATQYGLRESWDAWDNPDGVGVTGSFKNYVEDLVQNKGRTQAEAITQGMLRFANLARVWRVDPDFDFQKQTSEDGFYRARVGRPILDTLLSSYLEKTGAIGGGAINSTDKYRFRKPVLFEAKIPGSSTWKIVPWNDGFWVDGNGAIGLDGPRDGSMAGFTRATWNDDNELTNFEIAKVRVTVAIPCDHRLYAQEVSAKKGAGDEAVESDDESLIDPTFYRPMLIYAGGEFGKEIRINSYSPPAAAGGANSGDSAEILRNDLDKLIAHAQARMARYSRAGVSASLILPYQNIAMFPGIAIKDMQLVGREGSWPMRSMVRAVEHGTKDGNQFSILFLGRN